MTNPNNSITDLPLDATELKEKKLDSLAGLVEFENQMIIAAVDMAESTLRFSFHLHTILEYELWRHRKIDDTPQPAFNTQSEYLEYVRDVCEQSNARITGVSTMKAYHTSIRLAKSLGYSIDEIAEKGISVFNEVAKLVKLDRQTGEPLELKAGDVPDGYNISGYVRDVVDEVGPTNSHEMTMHRHDIVRGLESKLANKRPRVEFDIPDDSRPWHVTWHVEAYDEDGALLDVPNNHEQISNGMPDYVKEAWYKRIGCAWRLNPRGE